MKGNEIKRPVSWDNVFTVHQTDAFSDRESSAEMDMQRVKVTNVVKKHRVATSSFVSNHLCDERKRRENLKKSEEVMSLTLKT